MEAGGIIGAVAAMFVGISEMTALGAIFALVGGRPQETILGAVGGLLGGLAVGMMGGSTPIVLLANIGLVVGAIVGSTLRAYLRLLSLPIVLLGRILRGLQSPTAFALTHDGLVEQSVSAGTT
jgi:hypothetical protein